MSGLRWRDRRLWQVPGEGPIEISMQALVVAVLAVRIGEVGCTASAVVQLRETRRVGLPVGYELAFRGVPVDRFPPEVVTRFRRLEKDYVVVTAKATESTAAAGAGPLQGNVRFGVLGLPEAEFSLEFRPIGSEGWDRVQWLEFAGTLRLGRVTVVERGASAASRQDVFDLFLVSCDWGRSEVAPVWRLLPAGESGVWTAEASPGKYRVLMRGGLLPIDGAGFEVDLKPGQDVRIETDFGTIPLLRVNPRYGSGAPVHEVGIYVRRARAEGTYPIRELWITREPAGCIDGAELIPIPPGLRGEVEIAITKQGFQPVHATLELTDSDLVFSPVLEREAR